MIGTKVVSSEILHICDVITEVGDTKAIRYKHSQVITYYVEGAEVLGIDVADKKIIDDNIVGAIIEHDYVVGEQVV